MYVERYLFNWMLLSTWAGCFLSHCTVYAHRIWLQQRCLLLALSRNSPSRLGVGRARLRMWMKFIRLEKFQKIRRFARVHSKITPTINCGERKYSFSPRCLQDTQGTLGIQLLWSFHPSGAGIWWCNHPGVTHAPLSYLSTHLLLYVNSGYSLVHQATLVESFCCLWWWFPIWAEQMFLHGSTGNSHKKQQCWWLARLQRLYLETVCFSERHRPYQPHITHNYFDQATLSIRKRKDFLSSSFSPPTYWSFFIHRHTYIETHFCWKTYKAGKGHEIQFNSFLFRLSLTRFTY